MDFPQPKKRRRNSTTSDDESEFSTITNLERDPENKNFQRIDYAIRWVAMGMQFLMQGIYLQALQKDEEMRKAVETIRNVISGQIPMTKKGNRRVMKVAEDNEDSILWERLSDYGLFQFNRPLNSTLDEERMDVTGLKALLDNCSAFVIDGKKYHEREQGTNAESGWFPLFFKFGKLRNDIAHNVSKKMKNEKCEEWKQLILETIEKMVEIASRLELDSEIVAKIEKKRDEINHSLGLKRRMARIGGWDGSKFVRSAAYLEEGESEWKLLPDLPTGRRSHAVAVVGDKLFVAGGWNERNEIVGAMNCLDLKKMEWKQCPDMGKKRLHPIGCGFTNKNKPFVMVAGGWDGGEPLSSTEIYDLVEEKWETAGNMKKGRWGACAVKFGEQIWMMGGADRSDWLNSCEIFSIEQRSWKDGPEMNKKRRGPSATVANGTIYVAGGYSGNYESSVEYCKPTVNGKFVRNTFDQETQGPHWTIMEQRMKVPRSYFGLGSMGGHIYAVGGWDRRMDGIEEGWDRRRSLASVEVFKDGEWKETTPLDEPVTYFGGLAAFIR